MLRDCNETVKCYEMSSSILALRGNATKKGILLRKNGILLPKYGVLLPPQKGCYRSKILLRNRKYFDYFFKILFFDSLSNEIK